jgi:hypothetical protein
VTFFVQETSLSSTGTSVTLTLPKAATPGNGLIIAVSGFNGGTISGITIGSTGSLFTEFVATGNTSHNAQIWYCPSGSVASAIIVVTATTAGVLAWAYEVSGTITPDGSDWEWESSGSTWTSTATADTFPLQEFVVGIGATVGTTSTTITGPSSGGWINENTLNGVHAGSEFYSGVSGYQEQNFTSTAWTYSGTTTGTPGTAAAVGTFICMATQTGWGGYQFREHSSYTGISATFTIPSLSGEAGALSSMWVGLGGGNYDAIYQTGIYASYNTGSSGNNDSSCWSWWLPGAGELWNTTAYPTAAGDSLTLTIQLTSTDWLMTITNNTEDWTYTEVKSVLAVNVGSIQNGGAGPTAWPYPSETAQIIIEKEGSDANPDYGSVEFTSITTTPAIVTAPFGILTLNTGIDQYPGEFNLGSGSFTMTWTGYT